MDWKLEKWIEQAQWKIKNFSDFLSWVDRNPTRHRIAARDIMQELQKAIWWKDPIEYLNNLYYGWEKNSLDMILEDNKVQSINFFSRATLHRMLFWKDRFWWNPREKWERTLVHEEKLNERVESEIAQFEAEVSRLLDSREITRVFKMEEYKEKRYRAWKALYILKTLWWINKNILYRLSVDWWLSHAILAKSLNKELKAILERYPKLEINFEDVELYPQSINRWFKYNADKIANQQQ